MLTSRKVPATRLVIIDDRPLVRKSLKRRIDVARDFEICGQAGNREEVLQLLKAREPDLAIVGLRLGGIWGVDLIHELQTHHPKVAILVVSMFDTYFHAASAMRA